MEYYFFAWLDALLKIKRLGQQQQREVKMEAGRMGFSEEDTID